MLREKNLELIKTRTSVKGPSQLECVLDATIGPHLWWWGVYFVQVWYNLQGSVKSSFHLKTEPVPGSLYVLHDPTMSSPWRNSWLWSCPSGSFGCSRPPFVCPDPPVTFFMIYKKKKSRNNPAGIFAVPQNGESCFAGISPILSPRNGFHQILKLSELALFNA